MGAVVKIAVSIPAELYGALEDTRRRRVQTRSAAIQEALRDWLRRQAHADLAREYEAGYRSRPEGQREIDAAMATAMGLLNDENDW